VERSEPRILIGSDAYQIDIVQRLRPAAYWKTLARRLQVRKAAALKGL
jgi:hypothetical protein